MLHAQVIKERAMVVREAKTWLGTPYVSGARVKGAGCDCLTFVVQVFEDLKLIPPYSIPYYARDWHLHSSDERYMKGVLEFCDEVSPSSPPASPAWTPQPADVVLFKFGRSYSHGAIVIDWPLCMHAYVGARCGYCDAERDMHLVFIGEKVPDRGKRRPQKFFTLRRWLVHEAAD